MSLPGRRSENRHGAGLAMLLAGLSLTACGVGDDYKRPDVEIPSAFSQTAPSAGEPTGASWWRRFGSVALDGYIETADTRNLDIRAATARIRQADAQVRVAGAPLLPQLDLDSGFKRQQTPVSSSSERSSSRTYSTKPYLSNTYSASLSASYEIDFWGKNRYARESAEALAEANRFDRQTVTLTTQSSIADTYFAILANRERLDVARNTLANARDVLSAIRDRQAGGIATALDTAQQENTVATYEATIPPLEQTLGQSIDALAVLLGQAPGSLNVTEGSLGSLALPEVSPGLPSELLERRPDLRYAESELISANADLGQARAALFPSISLTAEYGVESPLVSSFFNPSSVLWSAASSLSQPIFHGGALEGGVILKEGRREELIANYQKAVLSALSDVEDALIATRQSALQEEAQKKALETYQRAYDLSQDQFKAGTTDIVTLLNTQRALFSAEDSLVQARLAHFQAIVGLFKALGGGWRGEAEETLPPWENVKAGKDEKNGF